MHWQSPSCTAGVDEVTKIEPAIVPDAPATREVSINALPASTRERFATTLALKSVWFQAHEIGRRGNKCAVRARPVRRRDVVSGFAGHVRNLGGAGTIYCL